MCFSVKATLYAQLQRAVKKNDKNAIEAVIKKIETAATQPGFHLSGFTHPKLLVYTSESEIPKACFWGLIPHWVKNRQQISKLWNKTLNARVETILEKPSYKDATLDKRCLIYVDGFYEFHHFKGKSYPFFIYSKKSEPLIIAGLWSEWFDRNNNQIIDTFTIVTTKAYGIMEKIHNNPKKEEARTPLILNKNQANFWIQENKINTDFINETIKLHSEKDLKAHTIQKLSGKNYLGNVEEVSDVFKYKDLVL